MNKKVLVIGAGLGGMATALRLAKKGFDVTIVEKYHQSGGRLNQLKKEGFTFDMGPSFFSMTYEFKQFIDDCGIDMPFEFIELDPLYTVHFAKNNQKYTIYKNLDKLSREFECVEPDFKNKMTKFLAQAGLLFHDTVDIVVKQNFQSLPQYLLQLTKVPIKHAPKMLRSVWSELNRHFESEEVKEIFSLVAFFLGATPFDTPAVYTLLSYTELVHDGYFNVQGGMYKITEGMQRELEKANVSIHYNTEIVDYSDQNGSLIFRDQYGNEWISDIYVVNSDAAYFRNKILNRSNFSDTKIANMQWTLAPLTIYLGVRGKIPNIEHHNYFLGTNFKEYASKVFKNEVKFDKPYYYVNVNSKSNPDCAPEGCENLFILCPVPDLRFKSDWHDAQEITDNIIRDLAERIGFDIQSNIITQTIMTPIDWEQSFNLYQGSGLGLGHGLSQIGAFRPKNYDEVYDNLFYVGASTLPGTGLPMVIISSKLVEERISKQYGTL